MDNKEISTSIIRYKKLQEITGLSRSTIWRKVSSGEFPKPISLGKNSIGWLSNEVEVWVISRPRVAYKHEGCNSPNSGYPYPMLIDAIKQ